MLDHGEEKALLDGPSSEVREIGIEGSQGKKALLDGHKD